MCPDRLHRPGRGFALPAAIFLLVVLALLGAFVIRIVGMQQQGSRLDVEGARAYQAARAGIEWGLFRVLSPAATAPCPFATSNQAFGTGFEAYTVTVTCSSSAVTEGGTATTLYSLVATACNQPANGACPNPNPTDGYVMRQIEAGTSR